MHAHVAGMGIGSQCWVGPEIRDSYKFPIYLKSLDASEALIREHGDSYVIDRLARKIRESHSVGGAVVLALDGVWSQKQPLSDSSIGQGKDTAFTFAEEFDTSLTQVYVPNDFIARETARFPFLYFGASVNPRRPDAIDRLRKAKAEGAVLCKWLPNIQLFDPADSANIPFFLELKALGLPLLSHAGEEDAFSTAVDSLGDPKRLTLALETGVIVIAAHAGTRGKVQGKPYFTRLMEMMPRYPNLYADISSLTQINKLGHLKKVLQRPETRGRLLYGSDYPLIQTRLVSPYYYPLALSMKKMKAIAHEGNPWDQDVALKRALGVAEGVFRRSADLILPKDSTGEALGGGGGKGADGPATGSIQ
jgi:predicted TIM-barrel fold metal-dependent hydrolase